MAVTKQTYTATATWTASGLASIFRSAFIDAGLMTEWYDSFLNTVENRILQVVYDSGKTYGTTYYWFQFTTSGVFVHTALGWDATGHVPTGTLYLDYFSTTTNSTTNHITLISAAATTTTTLTRYTSGINSGCTWFVARNGSTQRTFMIPSPTFGPSSFVDLNKFAFNTVVSPAATNGGNYSSIEFFHLSGHLRRTFLGAIACRGATSIGSYTVFPCFQRYLAIGNTSNQAATNYISTDTELGVWLPVASTNTQTGLASDHMPVFTGPSFCPYLANFPNDFGITAYYASNTMVIQDTLVVSSGVEEWEMLAVSLNSATDAGRVMMLARTV